MNDSLIELREISFFHIFNNDNCSFVHLRKVDKEFDRSDSSELSSSI